MMQLLPALVKASKAYLNDAGDAAQNSGAAPLSIDDATAFPG